MTHLADVAWCPVHDRLGSTVPIDLVMAHVVPALPFVRPLNMSLAVATRTAGKGATVAAVTEHGGTAEIGAWAHRTAPMVLRMAAGPALPDVAVPNFGTLYVDPALDGLPLLEMAKEWADRFGPLVVVRGEVRQHTHGRTRREGHVTVAGERIPAVVVEIGSDDTMTWCHEFAHLLAPDDLRHSEQFAETLGAAMLRTNPRTLAEVAPMVEQYADRERTDRATVPSAPAVAAVGGSEPSGLPADGIDSLCAFLGLSVGPT